MRIHPQHPHHGHDGHDDNPFHGRAAAYDRVAGRLMRRPFRRIAEDLAQQLPPGAGLLDVGTGPGRLLVEVARRRPDVRVTGVDLAPDMVETARGHLAEFGERAAVLVADVRELPFPDGAFDVIVSTLSLHHWADPAAGAVELNRVRRVGGQIRIYDLRSAPFAELQNALTGQGNGQTERFRISPLPVPALRLLVI
ncbi:MAG: class I SAM-dependent methyltransferase [Kineosporiaceae bacterium]|nr:class I SAM-dependent methyltransferase [Kineosporiaceae bacterium]MBK7621174.1 class I SAM-dependent methyltransferase [Kineosporiaceae bacterium]MBK8076027.1 class I SAM-dependent methyltransferase [Kineosporiaceae bacterium]